MTIQEGRDKLGHHSNHYSTAEKILKLRRFMNVTSHSDAMSRFC